MSSADLAEVQQELQVIKKALRDGTGYLGMRGENLTKYLLQLNEKENLLYSKQLTHMSLGGSDSMASALANGLGGKPRVQVPTVPAREPPSGNTKVYNKEDVGEIVTHMTEYEAVPVEGAKALRALSSLAYSDAGRVGGDGRVLPQLLRLLALHPEEQTVSIGGMRVLCNMAYDQAVSTNQLTDQGVLSALLAALPEVTADDASKPGSPAAKAKGGEAAAKAGEALARIVAAEVNPDGNGSAKKSASVDGSLARVFFAAASGEAAWQNRVPQLVKQLVANEVCEPKDIADRFVILSKSCSATAAASIGWMSLSKLLAAMEGTIPALPQCLVDTGALRVAVQIMDAQESEATVQLAGVEAMSALVGNRWAGLLAFAEAGGMKRIEAALSTHVEQYVLQTKGIRALASGIGWPEDVQRKAGYDAKKSLDITLAAIQRHGDQQELLTAGLEAVSKYLTKFPAAKDQVLEAKGGAMVQGIMKGYTEVKQIQDLGSTICGRLGI